MATQECVVKSQLSKVFDYDIVTMQKITQFLLLNVLNCCKSLPAHKHNLI